FQATVTGITPLRLNPKLPEQLEEIISKLLNKDGNLRYQGADELRNIIARLGRAAGPARIKGLRATLAWRTPGARWHFAPAGRFLRGNKVDDHQDNTVVVGAKNETR